MTFLVNVYYQTVQFAELNKFTDFFFNWEYVTTWWKSQK